MFKNLRLWANIMLGMGIAITLAVAALTYDNLHSMHQVIHDAKRAELSQYAETILVNVAAETRLARALSALVANIPDVQAHFATGDRSSWL
ncbi:MAG: hypothetical protein KDJ28_08120 [Candidatus Competibacteraceae bacterium]|nr:hypothetical protein [Candidatus Competibacteraceae bacterium]